LAYANENRPWELYQTVFEQTLCKCQELVRSQGGRKKFRFKNKLVSLDGSIIDLSVSMFDWAKFRRTKGAIKLHLLLDHDRRRSDHPTLFLNNLTHLLLGFIDPSIHGNESEEIAFSKQRQLQNWSGRISFSELDQ